MPVALGTGVGCRGKSPQDIEPAKCQSRLRVAGGVAHVSQGGDGAGSSCPPETNLEHKTVLSPGRMAPPLPETQPEATSLFCNGSQAFPGTNTGSPPGPRPPWSWVAWVQGRTRVGGLGVSLSRPGNPQECAWPGGSPVLRAALTRPSPHQLRFSLFTSTSIRVRSRPHAPSAFHLHHKQ